MALRLFVDDIRPAPKGWYLARTVTEAIRLLANHDWDVVSLDHDIFTECIVGEETITLLKGITPFNAHKSKEDFTAVAYFLEALTHVPHASTPKIIIHTANPVGYERLKGILLNYETTKDTTYGNEWENRNKI